MRILNYKWAASCFGAFCVVSNLAAVQLDFEIINRIKASSRQVEATADEDDEEIIRTLIDQNNEENKHLIPGSEHPVVYAVVDEIDEGEELVNDFNVDMAAKYSTTHRGAYHRAIGVFGDCVEMEDKSIWQVPGWSKDTVRDWNVSQTFIIAPNTNIFTRWSYPYKLINLDTRQIAKANMKLSPIFNDPNIDVFVHWIDHIDHVNGHVCLEDGSLWKIADKGTLRSFSQYDIVILGINDCWFRGSFPNILICVKNNKYVRGIVVN